MIYYCTVFVIFCFFKLTDLSEKMAKMNNPIWMQQKSIHAVILHSASGQVQALSDSDEGYIGGVVRALNDALVHRG